MIMIIPLIGEAVRCSLLILLGAQGACEGAIIFMIVDIWSGVYPILITGIGPSSVFPSTTAAGHGDPNLQSLHY
jgi:hypothetical protein